MIDIMVPGAAFRETPSGEVAGRVCSAGSIYRMVYGMTAYMAVVWLSFGELVEKNMGKRGAIGKESKRTSGKTTRLSVDSLAPSAGMSGRAVTVWKQIVSSFPQGHFGESDRVLLEQFCEAAGLHRASTALLEKVGRYYTDDKGVQRRHPATDDQRQARCDCAMLATKLRITKQAMISPKRAGRAQLDAYETKVADLHDHFDDLLFSSDAPHQ